MIVTHICFLPDHVTPTDVANLLDSTDLGFEPQRLRTSSFGRTSGVAYSAHTIDRVRAMTSGWIKIEGADGSTISFGGLAGGHQILINTPGWPPERFIDTASRLAGFTTAVVGDADDVFWQSADRPNTYEVFGRPWQHLPLVERSTLPNGRPQIDVSGNPGRSETGPAMWLWAAAKMWFGDFAFRLLDRERLLTLPVGSVDERNDGVVVVELFDPADDLTEIRSRQQRFRDWMGYDSFAERIEQLEREIANPHVEYHPSADGASMTIVEWLSAAGEPVPRSRAMRKRSTTRNERGDVMSQLDVDL